MPGMPTPVAPPAPPAPAATPPPAQPPQPPPAEKVVADWDAPAASEPEQPAPVPAPPAPAAAVVAGEGSSEPVGGAVAGVVEATEGVEALTVKPKKATKTAERTDMREHVNCVFIGHVDAGKSTFCGQVMLMTGQVDERSMQKYEKEAKEKNRESWFLAYIMDTDEEERAKGKTVQVGRAHFETATKRYTILDAPGHKNYVPNMIAGACQADVGVLVISARKGEFETGFERGGQTREHALLAKTLGVRLLIVVINKMDDSTVEWSEERYRECCDKLSPFLKQCGYNLKRDVLFIPISAMRGTNLMTRVDAKLCPWYQGPDDRCFVEVLDAQPAMDRKPEAPLRLPIIDKYRDMGTVIEGKVEQGTILEGGKYMLMPNRTRVVVDSVSLDETDVPTAFGGENVKVKLRDISEDDLKPGFVLSDLNSPAPVVRRFEAQVIVVELLEHKSIFSAGYAAVLHCHAIAEECSIVELTAEIDKKTGKRLKKKPMFVKSGGIVTCVIDVEQNICVETFDVCPQLGRFTLRDEGKTIGIGKILKILDIPPEEGGKKD